MVPHRGPFGQPLKLVVSIKVKQQTKRHIKSFRANTTSFVSKDRLQKRAKWV